MLRKIDFKRYIPHLAAIVLFFIITLAYFPEILEGKRLAGHDNANFMGMSREIRDFREETGKEPLWTNNMFGGMPAYLISTRYNGNTLRFLNRILQPGPRPVSFVFLYLLGFYILLLAMRVNPWLAIAGAIAFAFSSYNFVILAAGHNSKAIAIGYMAPVLAGVVLSFRGKLLLGASFTAVALSLQLLAGHPQITYYTMIMVLIFGIVQLYFSIREKYLSRLLITVGVLIVAVGMSLASNAARLWTTSEYGKYSMRNPSELSIDEEDKTSGLTKSYATRWSYGIDETFSLLIPGFKGGSSSGSLSENSATYELFARSNPAQAREVIKRLPLYWGGQASTMGNVYVGAIVIFLFIMGMFLVDPRIKWWLFAVSLLGILLAWGKNFMWLTDFFMEYIPGYNKFRTVSMTLVIPGIAMPLLGVLALQKIFFGKVEKKKIQYAMKWAAGITGGLSLLFFLLPGLAGNFVSPADSSYQQQLAEALQEDRRRLLRMDALRSLVFAGLAAGLILLYQMGKIRVNAAIAVMALLFLVDMWPVNKRYLNSSHFENKRRATQPFTPTAADQFIMNAAGPNDRVLNLTVSMFQDASTSFFHESIGGYHGAKMRRYQDMIETRIMDDINTLYTALQTQDIQKVDSALSKTNALNMLNTKYIIINPETQPILNRHAKGNAWFVHRIRVVEDADSEVAALTSIDLEKEATLDARYADRIKANTFRDDPSATIELVDYQPNRMVYNSQSGTELVAVFSEIFYEKGWRVTIDGERADHLRMNYTLRGMVLPEGSHEIVFEFHPGSYFTGSKVSLISSILLILLLAGAIYLYIKKESGENRENQEPSSAMLKI